MPTTDTSLTAVRYLEASFGINSADAAALSRLQREGRGEATSCCAARLRILSKINSGENLEFGPQGDMHDMHDD